jgi:hypothetical protein
MVPSCPDVYHASIADRHRYKYSFVDRIRILFDAEEYVEFVVGVLQSRLSPFEADANA